LGRLLHPSPDYLLPSLKLFKLLETDKLDNIERREHLARLYTQVQHPDWEDVEIEIKSLLSQVLQEFGAASPDTVLPELQGRYRALIAILNLRPSVERRYKLEQEKVNGTRT
jgi:hypothetical protein